MLQDLTIIIPTRERHDYIFRQIEYWKNENVKLIILDQSKSPLPQNNLFLSDNIKYYHFLNKNLFERISFASSLITSEYAIYLPDDEFLIPKTLSRCINFLDKNKDYVSCAGRSIEFSIKNRIVARNIYENLNDFDINFDDPYERTLNLAHPYKFQPIHSVSKSDVWKDVSKILLKCKDLPPDMFELLFGFTAAYLGKLKVINELMNLRSNENPPVDTIDWNQKFLAPKWFYSLNHKSEIESFLNALDEIELPNFKNSIIMGINSYCLNFLINEKSYRLKSEKLISRINHFIKILINRIYPKKFDSLIDHCKFNLSNDGIKVDYDKIILINKILKNFHKIK